MKATARCSRRAFFARAIPGAVLATGLRAGTETSRGALSSAAADHSPSPGTPSPSVGRPVRIASFCFVPNKPREEILRAVEAEAARGTDLIVLPETWLGQNDRSPERESGTTIQALADLAKRFRTYIVSPLDLLRDGQRRNTAVLLDRTGRIVGQYDKVFPYWSEYDLAQPVQPGADAPVFVTDFGKVGAAICFDVNFPEVWQRLADRGAELVVWPSAYSAGAQLQAYALLHHYYIVTATYTGDCQVYDITGQRLLDQHGNGIHITRVTLDLDRGIYHTNFNNVDGFLRAQAGRVTLDTFLEREQWYVIRATQPGVSARVLAREFGLEELRDYITRSRAGINQKRGRDVSSSASLAQ